MTVSAPGSAVSLSHARRPLGKTSLVVAPIAWGMWRFRGTDIPAARSLVEAALEIGVDLFDTADIYGPDNGESFGAAEALLGQIFAESPRLRGRMILATKGGIEIGAPYNSSAGYLIHACEASLSRLGVERIDLYQIHRPDTLTHPAEVAKALEQLRRAGKIAEAGVSNFTPSQVAALQAYLPFDLASIQPEFSPVAIDPISDGVLDQALERNMGVLAWSPLGGGRLGGGAPEQPRAKAVAAALDILAAREGVDRAAVAYAWIMAHPARPIPIIGSQRVERIKAAADAMKVRLSRADWYGVLTAARGIPLP